MNKLTRFDNAVPVGLGCECSWCGDDIFEDVAIRVPDGSGEYRFHQPCFMDVSFAWGDDRPRKRADLPYRTQRGIPGAMPFRWQDSARYAIAVRQYLDHKTIGTELKQRALDDVIAYMNHYIFAGCWNKGPELLNLRLMADRMETVEDIWSFIEGCLAIGLDPL